MTAAARSARIVFDLLIAYLGFALLYGTYRRATTGEPAGVLLVGIAATIGTLWVARRKLPPSVTSNLALLLLSLSLSAGVAEVYLAFRAPPDFRAQQEANRRRAAARLGLAYDGRTEAEVAEALSAGGIRAYPWVNGVIIRRRLREGWSRRGYGRADLIMPLGTVANSTIVLCNETGVYNNYISDYRGYNNPPGTWELARHGVAAIGDSYVYGACVQQHEGLVARLREKYPNTINLGVNAAGPLTVLAVVREYLNELDPRIVLWFYYEGNDLTDLVMESEDTLLTRYLTSFFRQGLADREREVDDLYREFYNVILTPEQQNLSRPPDHARQLINVAMLSHLRWFVAKLGRSKRADPLQAACCDLALFGRIVEEIRDAVVSNDGDLYFVYLPAWDRYEEPGDDDLHHRRDVLELVTALGVPVIDIHAAFAAHPRPQSLWYFNGSHYTPEGYRVAADAVLDFLATK